MASMVLARACGISAMVLLWASLVAVQADPCTKLQSRFKYAGGFAYARPTDALACTQLTPFEKERDLETLKSVKDSLRSFYALLKVGQQSPEPRLPSSFDPIAELDSIAKKKWKSMEDFYDAVSVAVGMINDGHTKFFPSFPPFQFSLALPLVQVVEGGKQVIRVAPASMFVSSHVEVMRKAPYSFNALKYAGARVDRINGVPAWSFLRSWVDRNPSSYHDPGQKMNEALASIPTYNGSYYISYGSFGGRYINPRTNTLSMVITPSGSNKAAPVSVPWLSVIWAGSVSYFSTSTTYFNRFCSSLKPVTSALTAFQKLVQTSKLFKAGGGGLAAGTLPAKFGNGLWNAAGGGGSEGGSTDGVPAPTAPRLRLIPEYGTERYNEITKRITRRTLRAKGAQLISTGDDYFPVFRVSDGKTAVVHLHTFYPQLPLNTDEDYIAYVNFFISELAKSFSLANRASERIIIDVSGNMGGLGNLLYWAAEMVVGSAALRRKNGIVDTPYNFLVETPVVKQMCKERLSVFNYAFWRDLQNKGFPSSDAFQQPLQNLTFGSKGKRGTYSDWYKEEFYFLGDVSGGEVPPAFGNKPVVILSNGLCFSACMAFVSVLKLGYGVPIATVGGIKGSTMAVGGGGGGFVAAVADDFIGQFSPTVMKLPDAPKPLGVSAGLSMTYNNGFRFDSAGNPKAGSNDIPLEFIFVPDDIRVDYNIKSVEDSTLVYQDVAKVAFKKELGSHDLEGT